MRRKRKRLSFGTIAMTVLMAVVLCCTAWAVLSIRGGRDALSMDAQRLSGSISALVAAVQPSAAPQITVSVVVTQPPATAEAQTIPPATQTPAPAETQPAAPTAAASKRTIELSIGGAFVPSAKLNSGTLDKASGQYLPQSLFAGIAEALHADVNVVLLDAAAAEQQKSAAWWAQAVKSAGFDWAVPVAEKPMDAASAEMQQQLSAVGVTLSGANAEQGYTMHMVNGIRLAVLTYAENAGAGSWIAAFDAQAAAAAIALARAHGAQLVLVCMNWKKGTTSEPTAAQKQMAQALCDAGADMILGMRSEMVYPVQYLQNSAQNGRKTLVAWSLGTLLSDSRADRAAVSSVLLHVTVSYDTASGAADYAKVEYTPCYAWGQEDGGIYRYRVLQSALTAPAGMVARQSDIMARALKLIREVMQQGVAVQR